MRNKICFLCLVVTLIFTFNLSFCHWDASVGQKLEKHVKLGLEKLEETYQMLDQITAGYLKLIEEQKEVIAHRIKSRFGYDEIYADHNSVVKGKK